VVLLSAAGAPRRCGHALVYNPYMRLLLFLLLAVGSQLQTPPQQVKLLHVEITGLRNDKGQVLCSLFSSARGFPKNSANVAAQIRSDISRGHAVCDFSGLDSGTYAISVFHDENSNGKLDTNFIGMPREGVGASNNAKGHFGPPKFDDAAIRYSSGRLDLTITIVYL
jgi:uncharacterized protein (DUF2141 family)